MVALPAPRVSDAELEESACASLRTLLAKQCVDTPAFQNTGDLLPAPSAKLEVSTPSTKTDRIVKHQPTRGR